MQANTLWACATLGYVPPVQALDRLAVHCQITLEGFSPQNISNSVWAFATLGHRPTVSITLRTAETEHSPTIVEGHDKRLEF